MGGNPEERHALAGYPPPVLGAREAEEVLADAQQPRELLHGLERVAILLVESKGEVTLARRLRRPLLAVVHALALATSLVGGACGGGRLDAHALAAALGVGGVRDERQQVLLDQLVHGLAAHLVVVARQQHRLGLRRAARRLGRSLQSAQRLRHLQADHGCERGLGSDLHWFHRRIGRAGTGR